MTLDIVYAILIGSIHVAVIVVRNSELLCGAMDKSVLGSGSKNNVFYVLLRDFGEEAAAAALSRLSKITSDFLSK